MKLGHYYFLVEFEDSALICHAHANFEADPRGELHFIRHYAPEALLRRYTDAICVLYIGRKAPKTYSFGVMPKGNTRLLEHTGAKVLGHTYEWPEENA